jgi:FkbM family methyltransferase
MSVLRRFLSAVQFRIRQHTEIIEHPWCAHSYSQEGEDMLLRSIFFEHLSLFGGFYVDVGACHPVRFSNTYFFYRNGWRGINIDPTPGSALLFNRMRPADINFEIGISKKSGFRTFFIFDEPALNTFSQKNAEETQKLGTYRLLSKRQIEVVPLSDVLGRCVREDQRIDFLSIDAEGADLDVLHSNDWSRHKPTVVLCEDKVVVGTPSAQPTPICEFLTGLGYRYCCRTPRTVIFCREQ